MVEKFIHFLKNSNHAVVYTGAGMSTESGIPDFRSASRGLWRKFNPKELANIHAIEKRPEEFTEFYRSRLKNLIEHNPHKGHNILAKWEKKGLIKGIITQNVDGFHYDAGSKNVMELHGTFRTFHCHHCGQPQTREKYLEGEVDCSSCGGLFRPGIVLFGENLPQKSFIKAENLAKNSDLFIVLGSSLTVSPANIFPLLAKENNAKLIIVNHDPTDFDPYADVFIQDKSIREVLIEVDQALETTN